MRTGKKSFGVITITGFVFLIVFLFSSCESKKRPEPVVGNIPTDVSFSKDIIPTLQSNCATAACHGGSQSPDLTPDNAYFDLISGNYIDTQSPENSYLYQKITGTGSMAEHSDPRQRALILQWIKDGAKDN